MHFLSSLKKGKRTEVGAMKKREEEMMFAVLLRSIAVAVLLAWPAYGFPASMKLERAFPPGWRVKLASLRDRDRWRHGRLLQAGVSGVADFPVEGSYNPTSVGLYFTRLKLGTPPKEFYVQIDTGSDILWVNCFSCDTCPRSSGFSFGLTSYSLQESSTAAPVGCSDQICTSSIQTLESVCSSGSSNSQCTYSLAYGDGSGTSGYYVSDLMYFDMVLQDESIANSSASVVFGCSNAQTGDLTKSDRALDGIFGFGQHDLSVISQLASQGVMPKVFSHCLKGSEDGGGILVLGEIIEPGIVYTPLVQLQPHYNLNLLNIAVNKQILAIDPAIFATSTNRGTIIDSGTTLAYLAAEAYDPLINSIVSSVPQSARSYQNKDEVCFTVTKSLNEMFPSIALNFQGGASMILKPEDYLLRDKSLDSDLVWCVAWQKAQDQNQGMTILGDLVLKNKIIVYDLAAQRIGWAPYDCSMAVNVSSTSGKNEFVNTGQLGTSSSASKVAFLYKITPKMHIGACLVHILVALGLLTL